MSTPQIHEATLQCYRMAVDHFQTHNTECDICKSAEAPNPAYDVIAKLEACSHIFHHHCITTWLSTQLNNPVNPSHGTCPMCRCVLLLNAAITNPAPPTLEVFGGGSLLEFARYMHSAPPWRT
ncbi:hypothetical protein CC86DRAFT_204498 [Ophiobolus disseminans]|uniref:RING-type domain-containing protein n=1 Tax=Ophiobolus disseminans TaxID=1469910 RepID=A0A6A7A4P1_9PLEO|nr:hypothetical protein CC86DRAFT_204498 [Ophiobolus disseminans]